MVRWRVDCLWIADGKEKRPRMINVTAIRDF